MTSVCVGDVIAVVEQHFPPALAESWDSNGLIVGDLQAPVQKIHCALDPVKETVSEALDAGADMLLTHHPLFLRGTDTVAEHTAKGALVTLLIRENCALYNAHTNGDSAIEGTAAVLAEMFELQHVQVIAPQDDAATVGLGRYGQLPTPMRAGDLGELMAKRLPATARGVALAGDQNREIRTLALLPGAGDSMLEQVRALGVDAVLTSDLRHHVAQEGAANGPVLFDAAHFATESPWMARLAKIVERELPSVQVSVSTLNTDPWQAAFVR